MNMIQNLAVVQILHVFFTIFTSSEKLKLKSKKHIFRSMSWGNTKRNEASRKAENYPLILFL